MKKLKPMQNCKFVEYKGKLVMPLGLWDYAEEVREVYPEFKDFLSFMYEFLEQKDKTKAKIGRYWCTLRYVWS